MLAIRTVNKNISASKSHMPWVSLLALVVGLASCAKEKPLEQTKPDPTFPVAVATPKNKRGHVVKDTYPDDPRATWTVLASGVRWRDAVVGDGAELTSDSIGYFHIKTFLSDGKFHHSTMNERKPVCAAIGVGRLQAEFEEALVGMRERGRRLVEFPKGLSYWSAGHLSDGPPLPPGDSPRFDVTLLLVKPQKSYPRPALEGGTETTATRKEVN
ncbi:MAG: FKBP-type peptidyl-prolyl cis-trans isomerase [Candidatus Sumerlaeaceae bacterium]